MIRTIDYSALTSPVSAAEVKHFRESARTRPEYATTAGVVRVIVALVVLLTVGFMFVGVLSSAASLIASSAESGATALVGLVVPLLLFAGFIAIAIVVVRSVVRGGKWERWMRLDRFASANGLVFSPSDANPQYPGAIFQLGRSRTAVDHLRSATDRFLDYGNYRYTTGSGKNQTTRTWGFMALQLDRALPNMVLDSTANNGLFGGTNLPTYFSKKQILHLEGDFDKYFTLYCPQEYERDALYIFTPDLMALLIDEASPFDVEIIDNWMFVYSGTTFDLAQPAIHQRLFSIIDTVGAKTLTQTDSYTDERVGNFAANMVAPQGQRLKRGVSVGAIIAIALFAALWGWSFLSDIIDTLFGR